MKKLLLVALIAGAGFTVSAQRHRTNDNDYSWNNSRNNNHRGYERQSAMERKIQSINYEYDAKINDVRHQFGLRQKVRNRRIARLEHERFAEIERCKKIMDAHSRDYGNDRDYRRR